MLVIDAHVASNIAVEKITKLLPPSFQHTPEDMQAEVPQVLAELFSQIHKSLVYLGGSYDEIEGMQTTMSLAWFTPFPLLVFPVLLEEKAEAARLQEARQRQIRRRSLLPRGDAPGWETLTRSRAYGQALQRVAQETEAAAVS